ncbi:glutaminyl-peptide cyclotransferase [Streptomyces sp. ISL-43]|uniref:glutaminyl-peptide cyclotransferase n=1 Tax=Streptomyces sp. ISL-43 TaxID=2819183 RepID=UPI0027E595F5|nr:glutaminyl-peptide cyclotransferase [Streptomyces sp. ISL-43]
MNPEPSATRLRRTGSGNRPRAVVAAVLLVVALLSGTGGAHTPGGHDHAAQAATLEPRTHRVQLLRAEVRGSLPHDPKAFTQGLEFRNGTLYESTGLVGQSSLRAGPPGKPATVSAELPAPLFGEGITLSGTKLWQLTWRNGIAIERNPITLEERRRVSYQGEGWGLCRLRAATREWLVMSDGTDRLTFRDPDTFRATGGVNVRQDGQAMTRLNELECAPDGFVYANVYGTDTIVRIDVQTGTVTARIDASGLLTASERRASRHLNGIAAVPGTDHFLITGKLWPRMFQVAFVPR